MAHGALVLPSDLTPALSVASGKSLPFIDFSVSICANVMDPCCLFPLFSSHAVASRALERVRALSHLVLCGSTGRMPSLPLPGGDFRDGVINSVWVGFLGWGSSSH